MIFCDVHGVLADFDTAARQRHGKVGAPHTPGEWNMSKEWGLTDEEFWAKCEGEQFWRYDIQEYPWMFGFLDALNKLDVVIYATSPAKDISSSSGVAGWLVDRSIIPGPHYRLMTGSHKHLLSAPGRVLVDDHDKNVERFRAGGGAAVLFPRPWNARHAETDWTMKGYENVLREVEVALCP